MPFDDTTRSPGMNFLFLSIIIPLLCPICFCMPHRVAESIA